MSDSKNLDTHLKGTALTLHMKISSVIMGSTIQLYNVSWGSGEALLSLRN